MSTLNRRRHRRQQGQVLPLVALMIVVLTGFAGTTVDLGHQFVVKRQLQAAADASALAGATTLGGATPTIQQTTPSTYNDPITLAAHDYAAANGFVTALPSSSGNGTNHSPACWTGGGVSNFQEMFFDSGHGASCSSGFPTTGFTTAVQVNIPPQTAPGFPPVPTQCAAPYAFNCVQVVVFSKVNNYIMGIFGQPTQYLEAVATGFASPGSSNVVLPQSYADYLYEPTSAYTASTALGKSTLSCTNCPTFWGNNVGGNVVIEGFDGSTLTPAAHFSAMVSNGAVVNQANTMTFCDGYGGSACPANQAPAGTSGFSTPSSSSGIYCSGIQVGTGFTCSNPPTNPGGLQKIAGNWVTSPSAQTYTPPAVSSVGLTDCGGLILNGDPITASNTPTVFFDRTTGLATTAATLPAACVPPTSEPYTIQPARYKYIVINHGQYEFEGGLYYVDGTAPVNSAAVSGALEANGIDHSQESKPVTNDWDLCNNASPVNSVAGTQTCPNLTAGVWIGHGWKCGGTNKCGAAVASTGTTCANGNVVGGTTGGGGDVTNIIGTGVSFYMAGTSGGFVSTDEVASINLTGPGVGGLPAVGGAPMLVNEQNNGWIHLDGVAGTSQFGGMVYQPSTVSGGGVDLDPSAAPGGAGELVGQIYAYSLHIFGGKGIAQDFRGGWGTSQNPTTGQTNESSLVTVPNNALTSVNGGTSEKLTVNYTDEWMLDAYDVTIQLNNLTTYYFSQPLWTIAPNNFTSGTEPPQNGYIPSDANPRYMAAGQGTPNYVPPSPYVAGAGTHEYTLHTDTGHTDDTIWDISGDWNWGNESNITAAANGTYHATIAYTFPTPAGAQVNVVLHVVDGDHCGDVDNVTTLINNVGTPSNVASGGGTNQLVQ